MKQLIMKLSKELKTRKDFNAHSIYHLLRGDNCINEETDKEIKAPFKRQSQKSACRKERS